MLLISGIKEFVTQSAKSAGEQECPLLEMLWCNYTIYYGTASEKINDGYAEIEEVTERLSQKKKRRLRRLVYDLCVVHEKIAFMEGIRVGSRLMMELRGEDGADLNG